MRLLITTSFYLHLNNNMAMSKTNNDLPEVSQLNLGPDTGDSQDKEKTRESPVSPEKEGPKESPVFPEKEGPKESPVFPEKEGPKESPVFPEETHLENFPGTTHKESAKDTQDSPDKSTRKDSPDKSVRKDSPDKSMRKESPDKSMRKESPDKAMRKESPDKAMRKESPDKAMRKESPVSRLELDLSFDSSPVRDFDFVSVSKRPSSSPEDSSEVQSEIEFDPEHTPRDPIPEGTRVSISDDGVLSESAVDADDYCPISLDSIPVEILLHICSFLEAEVIKHTMTRVCCKFQELFSDEAYWRIRLTKRWPKKYPPVDYDVDWQHCCVERERAHKLWSSPEETMDYFTYSDNLYAAVDVVHLMQDGRLLATGSRDRYLCVLDLSKYDVNRPETKADMKLQCINKAHNGWIWSMDSFDGHLYTGSWDTKIKMWDLQQNCTVVASYRCNSAVLDLHVEQNFMVAGAFDKKVYFMDTRQQRIISAKAWHRQPVLCVAADDNFIISGSEDKTFNVYDRRAGLVFKSVQVENYPLDISYHSNQLWFGDRQGQLNLLDTTMGKFDLVQSYNVGHTDKMTGVVHTDGAIYTSSNDKSLRVVEPSLDPETITTLTKHDSSVAGIDYQSGVLASAGGDVMVGVWRPKNQWVWVG